MGSTKGKVSSEKVVAQSQDNVDSKQEKKEAVRYRSLGYGGWANLYVMPE
ncbi:hypothetical protein [Natroniella sp. ANB-PHB2]